MRDARWLEERTGGRTHTGSPALSSGAGTSCSQILRGLEDWGFCVRWARWEEPYYVCWGHRSYLDGGVAADLCPREVDLYLVQGPQVPRWWCLTIGITTMLGRARRKRGKERGSNGMTPLAAPNLFQGGPVHATEMVEVVEEQTCCAPRMTGSYCVLLTARDSRATARKARKERGRCWGLIRSA